VFVKRGWHIVVRIQKQTFIQTLVTAKQSPFRCTDLVDIGENQSTKKSAHIPGFHLELTAPISVYHIARNITRADCLRDIFHFLS
jgi:hypothetical protein